MNYKKLQTTFLCIATIFLISCGPKKVDYQTFSMESTQENITESLGSEPNEEETTEDGGTAYTYKKSMYLDYAGEMSYQYYDDTLFYSKWTYTAKNQEKAQEVYEKICAQMKTDYGKGEENTEIPSTVYTTEDHTITIAYAQEDDHYIVCITDVLS